MDALSKGRLYKNFMYLPIPARSLIKTRVFSESIPPLWISLFPKIKHSLFPVSWDTEQPRQTEPLYYSYHYCCTVHWRSFKRLLSPSSCPEARFKNRCPSKVSLSCIHCIISPGQKIILLFTHSKCHLFSWKLNCLFPPLSLQDSLIEH